MRNQMPVRLLVCLLLGGVALEAQTNEQHRVPEMPSPANLQDQRLNRAPLQRTQPSDYHLPATAPTTTTPAAVPAAVATQAPSGSSIGVAETPSRRATVSYSAGLLSISAANSSLNQILRDISRTAGITITGGVAEERVFGQYGPGTPAEVLNDLLDGTGSNMLYIQGSGGKSSELMLSTRTGGPTPPSPHSSRFDAEDETPAAPPPPPQEQRSAGGQGDSQQPPPPTDSSQQQQQQPPATTTGSSSTSSDSSGDSSADQSSSGAKTPQQIFDELMKLRQQH